jgi:hypothetical protein
MRREVRTKLAAAIARDILRDDVPSGPDTADCHVCGRGMVDRGWFCSARCRDAYDAVFQSAIRISPVSFSKCPYAIGRSWQGRLASRSVRATTAQSWMPYGTGDAQQRHAARKSSTASQQLRADGENETDTSGKA